MIAEGKKEAKKHNIMFRPIKINWRRLSYQRLLLGVGLFLILSIILSIDFMPKRLTSIKVGRPSPETIKAPRSVAFIDAQKTEDLRREARKGVKGVYKYDSTVAAGAERNITQFFNRVLEVKSKTALSIEDQLKEIKKDSRSSISESVIRTCLSLSPEEVQKLGQETVELVREVMREKITVDSIGDKRADFKKKARRLNLSKEKSEIVAEVGSAYLEPNYLLDAKATEKLRREAAAKVKPYQLTVMQGQTIVREGDVVTRDQKKILERLKLLRESTDILKIIGVIFLTLSVLIFSSIYLRRYQSHIYKSNKLLLLLGLILLAVVLIARVVVPHLSFYLIPIAGAAMLTTILFTPGLAIVMILISVVFTGVIVSSQLQYFIVAILSGFFAVYLVTDITRRTELVRAGLLLSAGMAGLVFAMSLISGFGFTTTIASVGWGVISGFSSAIIAGGALPFLETAFNITTDMKLIELSNPNQPLLHDLMIRAPGTYNHSVVTGNLAEAAAKKVGANPLLARVAAYYHDIGKMKRPAFFVENQIGGENPHDRTNPNLSYLILTAHVKEGTEMAKKLRLPPEIIDIIDQHHGTSLVTYFFHRAREKGAKEEVSETDFRYPGKRPQTKEAALVMLADSVEAAARTIAKPSPSRLEQLARKIVQSKLEDSQLDQSNLTLADLDKVAKVFAHVLSSIYHSRIEYPQAEVLPLPRKIHGSPNK